MSIIGCRVYLMPGCAGTAFPFNCPQDTDFQIAGNDNIGSPNMPWTVNLNAQADINIVPFAPLPPQPQSLIVAAASAIQGAYYESQTTNYQTWKQTLDGMPVNFTQAIAADIWALTRFWQCVTLNHIQNLLHPITAPFFVGTAQRITAGIQDVTCLDAFGVDINITLIGDLVNPWYDVSDCRKFGFVTPTYENGYSGGMQWINFISTRLYFDRNGR